MRRLWGTSVLLCLALRLAAEGEISRKFYFHHFQTEAGLSNGLINDLHRDRQGLLWLATYNGLNCFDGVHFRSWKGNPFDPQALECSVVHGICEDKSGNIWCSTEAGVSRFDRKHFKNYSLVNQQTGEKSIYGNWRIVCTPKGEIYAESPSGLYLYESIRDSFIHFSPQLPNGQLRFGDIYKNAFALDSIHNGFWMGTDKGLHFFDLATRRYIDGDYNPRGWTVFNDHDVMPLTVDSKGRLVYNDVNARELITWDPTTKERSSLSTVAWYDHREHLATVFSDSQGNLWISTWFPSAYFVEAKSGRIFKLEHDPADEYSVGGNFFWDVQEDQDGTIYLGTVNGLSITNLRRSFFSILQMPDTVNHRTHYFGSIFLGEDLQKNLWFSPSFQYLLRYDPHTETFRKFEIFTKPDLVPTDWPRYVQSMQASTDTLYFGTTRGLFTFDIGTEKFARLQGIPDSISRKVQDLKFMRLTRKGELWGACHQYGLLRFDTHSKTFSIYKHDPNDPHSFSDGLVGQLDEDAHGEIWIGTSNDGPIRYDRAHDRFEYLPDTIRKQIGLGKFAFAQDQFGKFWLLDIVKGLLRYDPKTQTLEHNVNREALSHNTYGNMVLDRNHQLWLTFYNDFSILDTRDLTVENFTIQHSRADLKWWNYVTMLSDGRVLSESRNAVIIFDPSVRRAVTAMDPVTITNFVAADTVIAFLSADEVVELAYWQNHFSLDFGNLGLAKGAGLKFEYKLEGFDDNWVDCGARRTAFYTNVPGGNYKFKVRIADPTGVWHEGPQSVQIHLSSIFYKTTLFRILLALLLLAALIAWAVARRKRSQKKDYERAINYFANSRHGYNHVRDILWDITNNVITLTDLVDCVIYLVNDKGVLVKAAAYGEKNAEEYQNNPTAIPMGKGVVGMVAEAMQPEIVADTRKRADYIPSEIQGRSELAVPIVHNGRVLGVIDTEHPRKNFFTKVHLDLLTTIASISSSKIANALKVAEIEEKERRLHELQTQVFETRQLALRAQMNPHFIFNCLNSINSFVLENHQDTASRYLIKFAKLIRLILENSNSKLIPLQSELDALRLYVEMEALRFETKFTWEIQVDENVSVHYIMVPPLILQPFVENAIWHGLLHKNDAGSLVVAVSQQANRLVCTITDDGVGREASRQYKATSLNQKQSFGLKLTQERLALMHEQDNKKFKVEIIDLYDAAGAPIGTQVCIEMELTELEEDI